MKITLTINILQNGNYRAQIVEPKAMSREGPFSWKEARVPTVLMDLIAAKTAAGGESPFCLPVDLTLKELYAATY
jgi:hypothetical protein